MLQRARTLLLLAYLASHPAVADRSHDFADDLEQCIRNHAAEAARTLPDWADVCLPPTEKIDKQAAVYERTLASMYQKWGYQGALWVRCWRKHATPHLFPLPRALLPFCSPTVLHGTCFVCCALSAPSIRSG